MFNKFLRFLILCSCLNISYASTLNCVVVDKISLDPKPEAYPAANLAKFKPRVIVQTNPDAAYLTRCSYSSIEGKESCDTYKVDRTERDINVGIVKYYYFRGQFDVQVTAQLEFIENNGRGSISTGKCVVLVP